MIEVYPYYNIVYIYILFVYIYIYIFQIVFKICIMNIICIFVCILHIRLYFKDVGCEQESPVFGKYIYGNARHLQTFLATGGS